MLAEYKASILWARRQLGYAFRPLGIRFGECYLCGSLRWPSTLERCPEKAAKVISRNLGGPIREFAFSLLSKGYSIDDYTSELLLAFPEHKVFFEKVKYSDMDATIVPYKDGIVWSRYNLNSAMRKLLDSINFEVDRRFNLAPSYSAIEIGYPALKHKCTNISCIPVLPSLKVLRMRSECEPVARFLEEQAPQRGAEERMQWIER